MVQSTVEIVKVCVIMNLPSVIYCYWNCYLVLSDGTVHRITPYLCPHKYSKKTMKLPFKYIAILVIISLTGIFLYQTYWLTGLYQTMRSDMEQNIVEAMRISDYNEMMFRVNSLKKDDKDHGEVSVEAGYHDNGHSFVRSSASITRPGEPDTTRILYIDRRENTPKVQWMELDSAQQEMKQTLKDTITPSSALRANGSLDMILRDKNTMLELATYFQRGLHAGLDIIMEPDIMIFDSLLTIQLKEKGISLPHRLLQIHKGSTPDSTFTYIDTLAITGTTGYIPSPKAVLYDYSFDLNTNQSYRLWIEPITMLVLHQMLGILTTSFIVLIILIFAFWYLIRTILRQKTLEEMKSDFTNNITHELKTPIAVAYAANDALLNFNQAKEKAKRDKYLRICQEQLQRLSGLVEQILSMSMEHRKTFRLHPENLKVREVLDKLVEQHKLKADKPITITLNVEPEDLTVTADRTHFSNILSNLIDNAIKYSHERARIDIHCRTILTDSGKKNEISVHDYGIGISIEKQEHVFDKFYRVPTGNLHNVKGYGLGLFYVKTMTEKHGGSVSIKSELGKGSVFTIII